MKKIALFVAIATFIGLIWSCRGIELENIEVNKGYNYFPLQKGKFVIYDVTQKRFFTVNKDQHIVYKDSAVYQLKEEIVDTLRDAAGRQSFKIHRFTRPDATVAWTFVNAWYATGTDSQAERVEDNRRFVKLAFPIQKNGSFKGTQYLNEADTMQFVSQNGAHSCTISDVFTNWKSSYKQVDVPATINGRTFDSTLTVVHADQRGDNVKYRYVVEQYARRVGLVYRKTIILATQCTCATGGTCCPDFQKPFEQKAEDGIIQELKVVSFN